MKGFLSVFEQRKKTCRIAPTVMDNVSFDDAVMGEEIFGPIMPIISFDDFENTYADDKGPSGSGDGNTSDKSDEWADAKGGMKLVTLSMPNFKAYMLLVRDPSRIYVGTSSDFTDTSVEGVDIYGIVKKEGCVAAVNGGEFSDPGGMGTGNTPIGITYSKGNCVWAEETSKTFI